MQRKMPVKGSIETIFERLLKYINPVNPDWKNKIKKSSEERINEFKKYTEIEKAGLEFPAAYLEFLKHMGEDDGGLFWGLFGTCKFDLDTIIETNQEWYEIRNKKVETLPLDLKDALETFNNKMFYIGEDELSDNCYMQFKENNNYFITYNSLFFTDFEKMLFISAVYKYEKIYMQYSSTICFDKEENFDLVDFNLENILQRKSEWFSDVYWKIYATEKYSIILKKYLTLNYIFILSEDKNIHKNVQQLIENILKKENIKYEL